MMDGAPTSVGFILNRKGAKAAKKREGRIRGIFSRKEAQKVHKKWIK
jgi:hypothetical protein